jgi:hypothetical protein
VYVTGSLHRLAPLALASVRALLETHKNNHALGSLALCSGAFLLRGLRISNGGLQRRHLLLLRTQHRLKMSQAVVGLRQLRLKVRCRCNLLAGGRAHFLHCRLIWIAGPAVRCGMQATACH